MALVAADGQEQEPPDSVAVESFVSEARARYDSITSRLSGFDAVSAPVDDRTVVGHLDRGALRLATYEASSEEGLLRRRIYYAGDGPFFVLDRKEDQTGAIEEHRYYIDDGDLVRWIGPNGTDLATETESARQVTEDVVQDAEAVWSAFEGPGFIDRMGWWAFGVTAFIAVIIIGSFLVLARRYLRALYRAAKALNGAADRITGEDDTPQNVFPKGPRRLQDLWKRFVSEREATTLEHKGRALSTVDPSEIFHDEAIFDTYNRSFASTLAGFFTGLGILGTFAGLVIGLHRIDTTSAGMLDSVGNLLGGMSAAFYTSLVGIFFSLAWLVADRLLLDGVHRAASRFFLEVRQHYPVESADRLLHHLLTVEQEENQAIQDSRELLAEQKGVLQSMSADLAIAFEEAMTESLESTLAPQLERMNEAIRDLSVQMGDRQVEALDQMVGSFQQKLSSELHGHLEGLSDGLARAAEWQARVHGQMENLTERLSLAADRQAELLDATNSASEAFSGSLEGLSAAHRKIEASLFSIETAAHGVGSMAEALGDQTSILEERIAELGRENDVYRTANEEVREQLARQIDTLGSNMEELEEFWSRLGNNLDDAGKKLLGGAEEFSALTTQKLQEIFARFDTEMATVVDHLSGTLAEVRETTDELPQRLAELRETLAAQTQGMTQASARLETTVQRLETLEGLAQELSKLDSLGQSISNAADHMEGASTSFSELLAMLERGDGRGPPMPPGARPTAPPPAPTPEARTGDSG